MLFVKQGKTLGVAKISCLNNNKKNPFHKVILRSTAILAMLEKVRSLKRYQI